MKFVEIARFRNRLMAETISHALDEYDIPYLVQADDGGGCWGMMLDSSARILVLEDRTDEAELVLDSILHTMPQGGFERGVA